MDGGFSDKGTTFPSTHQTTGSAAVGCAGEEIPQLGIGVSEELDVFALGGLACEDRHRLVLSDVSDHILDVTTGSNAFLRALFPNRLLRRWSGNDLKIDVTSVRGGDEQ